MRMSDWSSDVCSSELRAISAARRRLRAWCNCTDAGSAKAGDLYERLQPRALGPASCEGRGRLGGGVHGLRRCPKAPLPSPPLPSQGREEEPAAEAAPTNPGATSPRAGGRRGAAVGRRRPDRPRSEEHTSELQSLMRISYAVFCLKKKKKTKTSRKIDNQTRQ